MLQQVVPRQENYAQNWAASLHNVESTISELWDLYTFGYNGCPARGAGNQVCLFASMCDVLTGCLIVWNLSVLDVLNWKKKKNEDHGKYLIWLDFKI